MLRPPPDFRLYHSNALDVLAGLLAEELRTPVAGAPLLAPETVLIPQAAMRRWLQATLAARHGVAANLEFLTPGEFVARALQANLGKASNDLDASGLHWRLYAALTDAELLAEPALAQIAGYLAGGDPLKPWTLAGELASVFEKYQAWRRDWLLRWEGGADADDPQAILWRTIVGGRSHRARRIQEYLAAFVDGDALPVGLPKRLFAFGILNVSPDVLRVLASQARVGTLHFYLPTPTREYWGDLQTLGARVRAGIDPFGADATETPLLRDWGAAGKDFMALLGDYEVVHPSGDIPAYADPEAGGHGRRSLLRQMQADLFHRRAQPTGDKRADIDAGDPSLQFHACHTRLRELQVLHDRLRALLEDDRFDPPLQPREIAVLAPDIDPYVPYLDAVFGGHGQADAIPYAKADASLLAEEPLAGVFLRLLALPLSRFGLEELLDLLASAPLAEAAGLDADDFERLRAWLHAAGARWGIDAAHRGRSGAPTDPAYTWQFALDRLLLGHASGDDALIEGARIEGASAGSGQAIAPWPELEGGALEALDRLLRQLRTLARYQTRLGEPLPPEAWRKRLLDLLDELLPETPSTPSTLRALERLRSLINDFARRANVAGFEAAVPPEVVRAHFAAVLGEADTRAPLLTGGVSFARMVPMRLLPFRVICLLGMNDGDFPRRDPAAGLNRLTAELGTERRRHGDRSTRDDDRYLFLQLFAAAQDAFYLSWLGADPRDGSVREPSALVTELLAAAGEYHARPAEAAQQLVLAHPLQPFSPAAFGKYDAAGKQDARVFSYRRHWHPAADSLSGERKPLAPWMRADAGLPASVEAEVELPLSTLRRFLLDPAGNFLRQRLGMRLPELDEVGEDIEPLQAPPRGLERHALQRAVFDALLRGDGMRAMQAELRARGLLPSGPAGARALEELADEIQPYAQAFAAWSDGAEATSLPIADAIDGLRVHARLDGVLPQGVARLRFGKHNGPSMIRNGLDWLLLGAAGIELPLVEVMQDADGEIAARPRARIEQEQARAALRSLLALRGKGLQAPLPFAPYSGWEFYSADTAERGIRKAAARWRGGHGQWSEGDNEALRLALRGRDPFAQAASLQAFADAACTIFGAVADGLSAAAPDVQDLLPEDEAEDAPHE